MASTAEQATREKVTAAVQFTIDTGTAPVSAQKPLMPS